MTLEPPRSSPFGGTNLVPPSSRFEPAGTGGLGDCDDLTFLTFSILFFHVLVRVTRVLITVRKNRSQTGRSVLTCLIAYLLICLLAYLLTCLLAYLRTCLLAYLLTC